MHERAARELDRDVAGAAAAHQGLLAMLDAAISDGRLDPDASSRLPGWTVGHVLTHLARNADSMTRVLRASAEGETIDRYADGVEGRDAEIEAGSDRPADEQVADVRRSTWTLEQTWAHSPWVGFSREVGGRELPVHDLPFLRWREVEVHRVDLGLGYEPADWPGEYVRLDLRELEMRYNARRPMGLTGLPPAALAVPPHQRLAWLLGRAQLPGLDSANVM